jgi:GNAT superfamily N-acetyltransferase
MIKKLTKTDFPDFIYLLHQLWPGKNINSKKCRQIYKYYLKNDNYLILGYFAEAGLIGALTLSLRRTFFHNGRTTIIEDLIVDKDWREKGIGRKLVKQAEKILHKLGIKNIELNTDFHREVARKFWLSLGYKCLGYQYRKLLMD